MIPLLLLLEIETFENSLMGITDPGEPTSDWEKEGTGLCGCVCVVSLFWVPPTALPGKRPDLPRKINGTLTCQDFKAWQAGLGWCLCIFIAAWNHGHVLFSLSVFSCSLLYPFSMFTATLRPSPVIQLQWSQVGGQPPPGPAASCTFVDWPQQAHLWVLHRNQWAQESVRCRASLPGAHGSPSGPVGPTPPILAPHPLGKGMEVGPPFLKADALGLKFLFPQGLWYWVYRILTSCLRRRFAESSVGSWGPQALLVLRSPAALGPEVPRRSWSRVPTLQGIWGQIALSRAYSLSHSARTTGCFWVLFFSSVF